ncbi:MAG: hypothetical protein AAGI46_07855 [Planctomycetota bacterium]
MALTITCLAAAAVAGHHLLLTIARECAAVKPVKLPPELQQQLS